MMQVRRSCAGSLAEIGDCGDARVGVSVGVSVSASVCVCDRERERGVLERKKNKEPRALLLSHQRGLLKEIQMNSIIKHTRRIVL